MDLVRTQESKNLAIHIKGTSVLTGKCTIVSASVTFLSFSLLSLQLSLASY